MLIPGKLYKVHRPYTFTGPANRSETSPLWELKFSELNRGNGKSIKKDDLVLCVEQFMTTELYRKPFENMGVFLYDNDYHILYEMDVDFVQ